MYIPVFQCVPILSCLSLGTTEKNLSLYIFPSDIFTYKAQLNQAFSSLHETVSAFPGQNAAAGHSHKTILTSKQVMDNHPFL